MPSATAKRTLKTMSLVSVLGCGTLFFSIEEQLYCRDRYPCQSCRSVLECTAPKMCHLSTKDQYICQSNQGIAEAVTGVLGGAQFSSCPLYHPSSSRCRFRRTRKAAVCAGNFSDSNGISDYVKRQKRSHSTEPVPSRDKRLDQFAEEDNSGDE